MEAMERGAAIPEQTLAGQRQVLTSFNRKPNGLRELC